MTNYDFSLEDKTKASKNKPGYNRLDPECIEGFVEDEGIKRGLFDELPLPPEIPPGIIMILYKCLNLIKEIHKFIINDFFKYFF